MIMDDNKWYVSTASGLESFTSFYKSLPFYTRDKLSEKEVLEIALKYSKGKCIYLP